MNTASSCGSRSVHRARSVASRWGTVMILKLVASRFVRTTQRPFRWSAPYSWSRSRGASVRGAHFDGPHGGHGRRGKLTRRHGHQHTPSRTTIPSGGSGGGGAMPRTPFGRRPPRGQRDREAPIRTHTVSTHSGHRATVPLPSKCRGTSTVAGGVSSRPVRPSTSPAMAARRGPAPSRTRANVAADRQSAFVPVPLASGSSAAATWRSACAGVGAPCAVAAHPRIRRRQRRRADRPRHDARRPLRRHAGSSGGG
jgi:hypothetical protein